MIHLEHQDLIGIGRTRTCYRHPHDHEKCIKIDHRAIGGATAKEVDYYLRISRIRPGIHFPHIPEYHGTVETNRGKGWVFDLVRDETNGEISKSLKHYINSGCAGVDDPAWVKAHSDYLAALLEGFLVFKDIRATNISVRCMLDGSYQMIAIDGLGHRDFLPVCDYVPWLNRIRMKKKLKNADFMTLDGICGGSFNKRAVPEKNADLKACAMDRIDRPYKVCVATLTRQRSQMLSALLVSWRQMATPASVELMFLVVENDSEPNSRELVDQYAGEFPHDQPLHYVLETELGIPFARNRAASYAINHGCDLLAFVDDDEVVAEYWLVRLMDGYRNGHAVLLGAPLRIARLTENVGFWRKIMYRNVAHRYARKERRAARLANLNETPRVTIVTNNWLAELSLFLPEGHGLRFDESMRFTGGTDAKFHAEVKQRGLTTGWVWDALVYETVPVSRLSFRYQLKRARDQANTHSLRTIHERRFGRLVLMLKVIPKLVGLLLLCAIVPFTFSRTLLPVARSAGWLMGAARAIAGYRSDLYAKVTGH